MAEPSKPDGLPSGGQYEAPKPPPKQNPVFRMMGKLHQCSSSLPVVEPA